MGNRFYWNSKEWQEFQGWRTHYHTPTHPHIQSTSHASAGKEVKEVRMKVFSLPERNNLEDSFFSDYRYKYSKSSTPIIIDNGKLSHPISLPIRSLINILCRFSFTLFNYTTPFSNQILEVHYLQILLSLRENEQKKVKTYFLIRISQLSCGVGRWEYFQKYVFHFFKIIINITK